MVKLLSSLTANCPDLELLDIRDNFLKAEAVEEMAKLIKASKNLVALNISDCNIEEDENDTIIEAIEQSENKIQKLGYNYAELNADQAKKLLKVLLNREVPLTRLDIKGNDFNNGTKKFYTENLREKGVSNVVSNFDSDDEDEDQDVAAQLV